MNEAERRAAANRPSDKARQQIREANERMAREAALARCDQCPEPKSKRDEVVSLPNGVRLSVHTAHCPQPGPDCTALVSSHLVSEAPDVGNRMVEWLVAQPELRAAGVSSWASGAIDAERLMLTYRAPELGRVTVVVGAMPVEMFRRHGQAEDSAPPDPAAE